MSKTCPSCGFRSPAGMRFCGGCGRPLSETSEVRTSPSTEVAQRRHITVMFCAESALPELRAARELLARSCAS